MEITNNSRFYSIPLVVNRRIAQIVFFDTDGILDSNKSYITAGKYQSTSSLEELQKNWSASSMLPQMYRDKEIFAPTSSASSIQEEIDNAIITRPTVG
jgi:hypothetical protein